MIVSSYQCYARLYMKLTVFSLRNTRDELTGSYAAIEDVGGKSCPLSSVPEGISVLDGFVRKERIDALSNPPGFPNIAINTSCTPNHGVPRPRYVSRIHQVINPSMPTLPMCSSVLCWSCPPNSATTSGSLPLLTTKTQSRSTRPPSRQLRFQHVARSARKLCLSGCCPNHSPYPSDPTPKSSESLRLSCFVQITSSQKRCK